MKHNLFCAAVCLAAGTSALPAQEAELTGTVSYSVGSRSGIVQRVWVTVGDGGSGPYKSVLAGDPSLPTHAIYRPRDLSPFSAGNRLPIVAFANGGCRNTSGEFRNFLSEIASHGFLVLAIGPAAHAAVLGSEAAVGGTNSSLLLDGAAWAVAENARQGSEYYQKIDPAKLAVMGQSCGGVQALDVSLDPRVTTTVIWNSGIFTNLPAGLAKTMGMPEVGKDTLQKLHAPIAYFIGGPTDVAFPNAADDFSRIAGVPAVLANRDVGHYPATYREPRGGAFAEAGVAWLKWQLKGDPAAGRMFTGPACGLCRDPKWKIQTKNLP